MINMLFSIQKVAEMIGVQNRTIKNYIRDGQLRAIRVSKNVVRIDEADLNEFLDKRKTI